jgi:hypothetical protein
MEEVRLTNLGLVVMGVTTTLLFLLTEARGFQVLYFLYFGLLVIRVSVANPVKS